MKKLFSKKFVIIYCIIVALFSAVIIPLFCVNGANVRNSMYHRGDLQVIGDDVWFYFYNAFEEELPEDFSITINAHVIEYKEGIKLNEFDSEIVFNHFDKLTTKNYYRARWMNSMLTSSTYELSINSVYYTKNGRLYMKMKEISSWAMKKEDIEDKYETLKGLQTALCCIMIIGYIACFLTIVIYATNKYSAWHDRRFGVRNMLHDKKVICKFCGAVNKGQDVECHGCGAPLNNEENID